MRIFLLIISFIIINSNIYSQNDCSLSVNGKVLDIKVRKRLKKTELKITNVDDIIVVHSVNIMVLILVISVTILIAYIMKYAYEEMNDGSDATTEQEKLL